VRIELWSWSAWLILGIVSYPAILLIWVAPRAGLLAGLLTGLLVAYTASLGYSARKELERPFTPTLLALAAGAAAAALALYADRVPARTAVFCALITVGEMMFAWNFLPWLVRDADAGEPKSEMRKSRFESRGEGESRSPSAVRPALGLVVMLALLALGLGSAWSKGEARVPGPTVWVVALGLLCLAFMFVERMAFFERAAREGNLVMAPGSYRSWLSLALCVLALSAALAAALPLRPAKRERATSRLGSAPAPTAAQLAADRLAGAASAVSAGARGAAAGLGLAPRAALSLLLLLLLLLLAVLLLWAARHGGRSRLLQRLLRAAQALLALAARAWYRCRQALARWLRGRRPAPAGGAQPEAADPLSEIFAEPDALAGLAAREIAIRAYHLLLNFADMLGHGRGHGQTPFEYARALEAVAPAAAESVLALTWAYSGAMYGGQWSEPADASLLRESWERVRAALVGEMAEEELALRRRAYLAARRVEQARQ
jgi:hypothetical protein